MLETNLGEITLRRFSSVNIWHERISRINVENFSNGLAFHNLELWGNTLPEHISVQFLHGTRINRLNFFDYHDMNLSGIPLSVQFIEMPVSSGRATNRGALDTDTYIALQGIANTITLADSTVLNTNGSSMNLYKGNERWMLANSMLSTLYVTRPGEAEAVRYFSAEFGIDWGYFLGGITYEEMEVLREESRRRQMSRIIR